MSLWIMTFSFFRTQGDTFLKLFLLSYSFKFFLWLWLIFLKDVIGFSCYTVVANMFCKTSKLLVWNPIDQKIFRTSQLIRTLENFTYNVENGEENNFLALVLEDNTHTRHRFDKTIVFIQQTFISFNFFSCTLSIKDTWKVKAF